MNEAETRAELIDPKLEACGWGITEGSKILREYNITAGKMQYSGIRGKKTIEDYRLEELIFKYLTAYPNSGFGEIHQRIGMEINQFKVKRLLKSMLDKGVIVSLGERKWTKYFIKQNLQENE